MTPGIDSIMVSLAVAGVFVLAARARLPAPLSPVVVTALIVGGALAATRTPVERFETLAGPLRWALGPAIVALGATLHLNRAVLRRHGGPLLLAVAVGTTAGVGSAVALARALGLAPDLAAATVTRTISTPFAILVQTRVGGPVALGAALAVTTGVIGAVLLPPLLARLGLTGPATIGTATGVAAHIVGADAVGRRDPAAAGFAGVALVIAGILVAVAVPPLWGWLTG